jgi:transcriptional regulator with XRE-family HTH domain
MLARKLLLHRYFMRKNGISYRALAAQTRLIDPEGKGLSYSHIANLASGRETPTPRAVELVAQALDLAPTYFAEYRIASLRRELDEREVGFARAYRTYQALSRHRFTPAR